MDIDKLILFRAGHHRAVSFGSLMDIDKLIRLAYSSEKDSSFGSLMDIDELILNLIKNKAELY